MKIIGFKVENIRLLKAFAMKFKDKGLTQIRGKNKQGKSTAWDCLELLLRGNKMQTEDMISHGEEKAEIIGQVDKWLIKRVIKKEGSNTLEVRDMDTKLRLDTKPQDFLDSLINELTFNPLPWLNKSSDEKLRFISDLTGLDLTQVETEIKKAECDRYDAGVVLRNLGAKPDKVEKVMAVSVTKLFDRLDAEKDKQQDIVAYGEKLEETKRAKIRADEDILRLEKELNFARTAKEQILEDIKKTDSLVKSLPKPKIAEAQKAFNDAEGINEKATAYATWVADHEKWIKANDTRIKYEVAVKDARINKDQLLRAAKMPIKGMEIRDDGLYFSGTHCENWSDSEGYEIALDLCVVMLRRESPDKKLEAIFINNGNLFDSDTQKALQKWAEKHDIQVGIAIVDDDVKPSADGVFYIVAGEVQ